MHYLGYKGLGRCKAKTVSNYLIAMMNSMTILKKIFDFFRSKYLALGLMVVILVTILVGTVFLSEPVAQKFVFKALWFNALLVLLVLNTACCFFSRIHRRSWTLVSSGMILFHLSFVAMFAGIFVNNLFYFNGSLRLTEGETIGLGEPIGYDQVELGRFFKQSWLRGVVTLHKLHTDYRDGQEKKGAACEISVVDGTRSVTGVVYPTHHLMFNGFKFFRDKEGFAPLFMLSDRSGKELYGAYVSLQSFKQKDGTFIHTTGTKQEGPGSADFPQIPDITQLYKIQFTYHPPKLEKGISEASFKVWEFDQRKEYGQGLLIYEGTAPLGDKVSFGDHALSMKDVRYWASMDVLYNPGQPLVLASFWVGFAGLVLTAVARFKK